MRIVKNFNPKNEAFSDDMFFYSYGKLEVKDHRWLEEALKGGL
jgi:hypothetical protein